MIKRIVGIGIFLATLSWAQPPALNGIAHVAFRVADVTVGRAFYQKLGFDQFFELTRDGQTTEAFLKVNDLQFIELYPRNAQQPSGLMHICYLSNDMSVIHNIATMTC